MHGVSSLLGLPGPGATLPGLPPPPGADVQEISEAEVLARVLTCPFATVGKGQGRPATVWHDASARLPAMRARARRALRTFVEATVSSGRAECAPRSQRMEGRALSCRAGQRCPCRLGGADSCFLGGQLVNGLAEHLGPDGQ